MNFIPCDLFLAEQIRSTEKRYPYLKLTVTDELVPEIDTDVYAVPAARIADLFQCAENEALFRPVIAYGPPEWVNLAFSTGCIDYLKDPWTVDELDWRAALSVDRIDARFAFPCGRIVVEGGQIVHPSGRMPLTYPESRILKTLLLNRGTVVSRDALFYTVWGRLPSRASRAVDVHVSSIRKKLKNAIGEHAGAFISSARGLGYVMH